MKTITEYEIVNHGVENSQYFQGCGLSHSTFDDIATGIGDSAHEALEDALEQLAMDDWETETVKNELSKNLTVPEDCEDCHYYVSIKVK